MRFMMPPILSLVIFAFIVIFVIIIILGLNILYLISRKIKKVIRMAINSKIEWTGSTWNPITGCTKCSLGCLNCYAERMAKRLQKIGVPKYKNGS